MKTLKVYRILLVTLVLMNVLTIGFLMMKPEHRPLPPDRVNLAEKLEIKGGKANLVSRIQKEHHREIRRLNQQNQQLHHQLYLEFLKDNKDSTNSERIIDSIIENHRSVVNLLYAYFNELKTYCNPQQRILLNKHFEEVIQRNGPPPHHKRRAH
jgi:protein CpxP